MRITTVGLVGLLALIPAGAATSAYAQDSVRVTADIPFTFQAGRKTLEAGHYEFRGTNNDNAINVRGPAKTDEVVVIVETRLADDIHSHEPADAHVVFDVVNGQHILSELWQSGFDGFVLHATREAHTHRVVTIPRKES